ncbi:MAG: ATP-binding protein [Gammaproteobacteria bacterium]|nr:ATP-binding protein [Gammaproteobacteria bacterium]
MIYDQAEIRERIRLGEDSGCEFKQIVFAGDTPRRPRRDDLADEIGALANAGGGLLLCGVTDDGRVPGMTRGRLSALDSLIVEVSTDAVKPPVAVRTCHRTLDGAPLVVVEVPEGEALHDSPGENLVRIGASKKRMASDQRACASPSAAAPGQALPRGRRAVGVARAAQARQVRPRRRVPGRRTAGRRVGEVVAGLSTRVATNQGRPTPEPCPCRLPRRNRTVYLF